MNRRLKFNLCMLAAMGSALAQAPVAHWSFDHGATGFYSKDETGHGYELVALHKPDSLVLVKGVVGNGLRFAGSNFELEATGSRGSFNFPQFTLEAIVQNPGHTGSILDYTEYRSGVAKGYWMGFAPDNVLTFNTGFEANDPKWNETKSNSKLTAGKVYHVAAVFNDNGLNKVYVDGKEAGNQPSTGYRNNDGRVKVGYNYGDGGFRGYLTGGAVDEIKVFGNVLSATEIDSHYQAVKPVIDSLNALP